MRAQAIAFCLGLLALSACSDDPASPVDANPDSGVVPADGPLAAEIGGEPAAARVVGSLIRAPHSWPIVNWSSLRGLNATLDQDGDPAGSFKLEIQIDFGAGPFLQQTTEEVICLEVAARDEHTTDIWISSAAQGWVTVPPGATHYSIQHIVDSPGGDLFAARSILPAVDGDPADFCKTRPDFSATDPFGLGPVELMTAEAGNVVVLDR